MTSQTKHYIEASDILSVRCDCKECGASLSLPLTVNLAESLFKCPNCKKPWVRFEGGTHEFVINALAENIGKLKELLPGAAFKIHFEISSDPASTGKD